MLEPDGLDNSLQESFAPFGVKIEKEAKEVPGRHFSHILDTRYHSKNPLTAEVYCHRQERVEHKYVDLQNSKLSFSATYVPCTERVANNSSGSDAKAQWKLVEQAHDVH